MKARHLGAAIVAALFAGAFFASAAPPTDCFPALWLGMAVLASLNEPSSEAGSARRSVGVGLSFGWAANVVALRFVPKVIATFTSASWWLGVIALALLALEQSVRWGVATAIHRGLGRRGVPSWWAFATGVFAGTFVPAVFPWSAAGGVTPVPEMVQLAEWVGERGVTFVMALSAGLLASAVNALGKREPRRRPLTLVTVALAIPLLTFVGGRARIKSVEATRAAAATIRVALVEPSIDAVDRWDPMQFSLILEKLTRPTSSAERDGAELTVWPEAAYPYPVAHVTRRCPIGPLAMLPFGVRGPVLTGLVTTGANGDVWNSAALCRTDGTLEAPQDKIHLLWFGETIPWLDRITWVRATFSRGLGLVAGSETVLQRTGLMRAAVLNCFEDTLPDAGREAMSARPNLLVNVTNDAWFRGSAESELHLRLGALRAVESRRDLVRAVNEGVTSWVDAAGVVRARVTGNEPAVVMANAALLETPPTLFDRCGDILLTCLLVTTTAFAVVRERRRASVA